MDKLKQHIQGNRSKLDIDQPSAEVWNHIKQVLAEAVDVDLLKNHLAQNAEELEIEAPASPTWTTIQTTINTKRTMRAMHIRKVVAYCAAACILVIVGIGTLVFLNQSTNLNDRGTANIPSKVSPPSLDYTIPDTMLAEVVEIPLQRNRQSKQTHVQSPVNGTAYKTSKEKRSSLPSQFLDVEHGYNALIARQVKNTQSLALYGENPEYFAGFVNDFKALDQQEKQLRKSLVSDGMKDESIANLAIIYQQKLTVLKKLQIEINKISNRSKGVTDTLPAYIQL